MKSRLSLIGSAVVAALLLCGAARADDPGMGTVSTGANGVFSNNGVGASAQLNIQGPEAPNFRGNAEIGGLRTYGGENRLIGNVGALKCDSEVCFGSTRLLHSDGVYEQLNPVGIGFGYIDKGLAFTAGPRVLLLRDEDRRLNLIGIGGEAYFDKTLGYEGDVALLTQIAQVASSQASGIFYSIELKLREKIAGNTSANLGIQVSDAALKSVDASGNTFGSSSSNASVAVTGGVSAIW